MTTPIYDFLKNYIQSDFSRLHMPGHKGRLAMYKNQPLSFVAPYDITEISGADELFDANGIIEQAECNTANLYGAKHTSFSTGGSTACIQTMLRLIVNEGENIIAARNVHISFVNACALLGINVHFIMPSFNDSFLVSGEVTADQIEQAILSCNFAKAVYITSPDYLGCISDVAKIAQVCDKYNVPLIVDNAHGAHLRFLPQDVHPMTLGATLCCDSAHKTLPVLTGGAYLHVSHKSGINKSEVKSAMAMFASTSPSYLILMSLDLNNKYLETYAKRDFYELETTVNEILIIAQSIGFSVISKNFDITKITLDAYKIGLTGEELKKYFQQHKIEPEYTTSRHVVLMISPQNNKQDIIRLKNALSVLNTKEEISSKSINYTLPKKSVSIRQAIMSPKYLVKTDDAEGKIAADVITKCPPGVPIIIPGEIIDKKTQKLLKISSIFELYVLK